MTSLREFLTGIIDYAGLFPPARLDMSSAVRAYAEHRASAEQDLLGRFVVPAARLDEFSAAASALLPRHGEPWRLSVIGGNDLDRTRASLDHFNAVHNLGSAAGHAVCDTVELPVGSHDDIGNAVAIFDESLSLFLEVSSAADPAYLISAIADTPASAKLRTGGVVESAIPTPDRVLKFIELCVDNGVPFKATAGLHHAIRGRYPLTYEQNSPIVTMFGYLNIFFAAAFCAAGTSPGTVLGALEETDPSQFRCDDVGVWWQDHVVIHEQLSVVRQAVATSFGSCSFSEPVDEARNLHLI
jgi:hypothetical protein